MNVVGKWNNVPAYFAPYTKVVAFDAGEFDELELDNLDAKEVEARVKLYVAWRAASVSHPYTTDHCIKMAIAGTPVPDGVQKFEEEE